MISKLGIYLWGLNNSKFIINLLLLYVGVSLIGSCKKEFKDVGLTDDLNCEMIGLEKDHSKHDQYQAIITKYVDNGFPGITALVKDEEGIWIGSAGKANIKEKQNLKNCNVFFSGSVAKMYTVTAAMTLYEQGLLDLDAKIENFLPKEVVENLPNAKLVTIRQLMNHTTGIPDHDLEEGLSRWSDQRDGALPSAVDQLSYLYDNEPLFLPGDTASYSSANTLTLSLVIDHIAGEHHSNIISREIINKLGLTETFYKNEIGYPTPKGLVRGYYGTEEDITKESINYCRDSQGDAGIIASAYDYYQFLEGLVNNRIVSGSTLQEMLIGREAVHGSLNGVNFSLDLGLGLFLIKTEGEVVKLGHSGITTGGMSHVYYYPQKDSYLVLLTNTIIDEDPELFSQWAGNTVVGLGGESLTEEFEELILD